MSSSNNSNHDISALELKTRLLNNELLILLDVREKIEYHTHNIGGINVPLGKLKDSLKLLNLQPDEEIIVVCSAGLRSETAQSILKENGYHNVRNLTGGLLAIEKIKSI